MEKLNKETYITNHDFMSFTRFSRFLSCEAAAAANFKSETTNAMLVSSFVDAHFSNEMEEFKNSHPEIFNSRTGELKNDFKQALSIINRLENDKVAMEFMSGEKQAIMTGEIYGVKFKIKMDSYKKGKFITDLKVMKDFQPVWTGYGKVNFIEAYNYDIELAIFQEIVRQNTGETLPCYICGITKETPEDIAIFEIPQDSLDKAMEIVKNNIGRIEKILKGEIAPHRCEKCEYCRGTKKARVLTFDLAGLDGDHLRENGIESDDPIINKKGE